MKNLLAVTVIVGLIGMLAVGCATTAKGPTDEEMISKRIQEGMAAIKDKNFDAFTGLVSPSFSSYVVGNRDDLLAYLKNANDMGFLDDLGVDLTGAKTTVEGDKATVSPVVANGSFGSITLEFTGIKEKGVWVIDGLEPGY